MINTPYLKTIYLDCDTIVADNISEIYKMLDEYDIAASNPPFKNKNYKPNSYQAGIVFYRMNETVKRFLNLWNENYDRVNDGNDQPSFRRMLSKLDISLFIFPPNYNFRSPFASYIQGKIKIFHDHNLSRVNDKIRQKFVNYLNLSNEERYWFPKKGVLEFSKKESGVTRIFYTIEKYIRDKKYSRLYYFLIKKLINYYFIKTFPRLLSWIIPKQYRDRMKTMNQKLMLF
jgi:hypothetical protein